MSGDITFISGDTTLISGDNATYRKYRTCRTYRKFSYAICPQWLRNRTVGNGL
jgi:hypothetical protein